VDAAEQTGEASEQDIQVEGLGEIVVGAGGKAFDDVLGAAAGGEHEDGDEAAGFAEGAEDGEAVLAGKHDVEQDGGGRLGGVHEPAEGGVAVGFVVGAVALGLQVEEESLGEVFFVLDDGDERRGHWGDCSWGVRGEELGVRGGRGWDTQRLMR